MSVRIEDVEHIARLARLGLREEEKHSLRGELEAILGYVEKLRSLPTEAVEPSDAHLDRAAALREDHVTNRPRADELLAGAPDREETFFRVPRIIE